MTAYATRSNAYRAARELCRKALGPAFQAYEGHDYIIHPVSPTLEQILAGKYRDRYKVELNGPAAEAAAY